VSATFTSTLTLTLSDRATEARVKRVLASPNVELLGRPNIIIIKKKNGRLGILLNE